MTLENQNERIHNPTKQDLDAYLNCMFDDVDQFVTLTRAKADFGVRYVQACFAGTKLIVQLGIEKGNSTKLVEKVCSNSNECVEIFYLFYSSGKVDNLGEYLPVQF